MIRLRNLFRKQWWLAALTRDHVRLSVASLPCALGVLATGSGWLYSAVADPLINVNTGWIAFSASYLVLTGLVFARATPESTERWARREQRSSRSWFIRWFVGDARGFWFVITVAVFAVIAALLMIQSDDADGNEVVLGTVGGVLSWLMMQTAFTLHYAYAYHNGGGVRLDDEPEPDLFDFAYVAFTIGTSFTIVDASITSRQLRRVVLGHSVLSFAFNTVLLGFVVTFLAGEPRKDMAIPPSQGHGKPCPYADDTPCPYASEISSNNPAGGPSWFRPRDRRR